MRDDHLAHYGVLGMKWGVRRARVKAAKQDRRNRMSKMQPAFDTAIGNAKAAEARYKVDKSDTNNRLRKKAMADFDKQLDKTMKGADRINADYKRAKKDKSKDLQIANKLYPGRSKNTNKRMVNTSAGKAILQEALFGAYGSVKYNQFRGEQSSRGKAALKAAGHTLVSAIPVAGGFITDIEEHRARQPRKK